MKTRGSEKWAVSLIDLRPCGMRYWAFERFTGKDVEHGLNDLGYPTLSAAKTAIRKIDKTGGIRVSA